MLNKTKTKNNKNMVCKLFKTLYGLKQLPYFLYKRLSAFLLKKLGFICIYADYSIFITKTGLNNPIISIFVNDIKIIGIKKNGFVKKNTVELVTIFLIVDIGSLSFYLSLKVI